MDVNGWIEKSGYDRRRLKQKRFSSRCRRTKRETERGGWRVADRGMGWWRVEKVKESVQAIARRWIWRYGAVRCGLWCWVPEEETKREKGSESSRRMKGRVLFFMYDWDLISIKSNDKHIFQMHIIFIYVSIYGSVQYYRTHGAVVPISCRSFGNCSVLITGWFGIIG